MKTKNFKLRIQSSLPLINLKSKIIDYINDYPCCVNYPKCYHAKKQSNAILHEQTFAKDLVQDYLTNLNFFCTHYAIKYSKINYLQMWAFHTTVGQAVDSIKHNHIHDKNSYEISSILYFDNGNLGTTLFCNDAFTIELKEIKEQWIFFESKVDHEPHKGISDKERVVLATSIGLCLEN
tara:strand:- start:3541 stop:4077 length:537 start_codon:yes stop_codon:yes gene_type:complete